MRHVAPWLVALITALSASSVHADPPSPEKHASPKAHHKDHGHHGGGMHHGFKDVARWVKVFDHPEREQWQQPAAVVAAMTLEPGMTVADIGAGTGYFLPHLREAVGETGRVLALDIEPNMVAYMTERATQAGWTNVEARTIPTDDPKLPAASVDRVLFVNTWHHVSHRQAYARKLARALKTDGQLVIVDFTMTSDKGPPKRHRLAPDVVIQELTAAGFEARVVPAPLPNQYVVTAHPRTP